MFKEWKEQNPEKDGDRDGDGASDNTTSEESNKEFSETMPISCWSEVSVCECDKCRHMSRGVRVLQHFFQTLENTLVQSEWSHVDHSYFPNWFKSRLRSSCHQSYALSKHGSAHVKEGIYHLLYKKYHVERHILSDCRNLLPPSIRWNCVHSPQSILALSYETLECVIGTKGLRELQSNMGIDPEYAVSQSEGFNNGIQCFICGYQSIYYSGTEVLPHSVFDVNYCWQCHMAYAKANPR